MPTVASPDQGTTLQQPPPGINNPNAPFGYPPTWLTAQQIAGFAWAAGFKGQALITAIAVALAESHGFTAAHNSYVERGITYHVWGLWQESTIHPEVTQVLATNPQWAANEAYQLSGGGNNWQPWSTYTGGQYLQFISDAQAAAPGAAAAAATVLSSGSGAFDVAFGSSPGKFPTAPDVNPNDTATEFTYKGQTTTYGVTQVWSVDDISVELVGANGQLLNLPGLKSVQVGGTGSTLQDLLVSAEVSLDNSQSTQVTLTFEQGDVIAREGIGFPADPSTLISKVTLRDLDLAVSSAQLTADGAGRPQWQVICIAEGQMKMMNAFPPPGAVGNAGIENPYAPKAILGASDPSVDPTANPPQPSTQSSESACGYVNRMCKLLNIRAFYGETATLDGQVAIGGEGGTADLAAYNAAGSPEAGTLPDSVWVYIQRLAGYVGYWFYESAGAIWFAQPSTLASWGNKLWVVYQPVDSGVGPDYRAPIGTPQISADIEEIPGGFAHVNKRKIVRKVSVRLAPWYGCQARPGDELVLSGLGVAWDTDPTEGWKAAGVSSTGQWPKPDARYIITGVNFAIDGGLSPVTIKAEEVQDPDPQISAFQIGTNANGASVQPLYQGTASGGSEPASYVTPSGVEANLSANYKTGKFAADALKLAVSQVGVWYQWGGVSPQTGFDCSGLVYWACLSVGVNGAQQPRTSQQLWSAISAAHTQLTVGQALNIPFALLFPADPASAPTHVAISLGDGHSVLQAPQTGEKVNISDISANGWLVQAGTLPYLSYQSPTPPSGSPDAHP